MNPTRLQKSELIENCYFSASLGHSRYKVESAKILYPPGSYFVDSEESRQKVLRTGKKIRASVVEKPLLPRPFQVANDYVITIEVVGKSDASLDDNIQAPLLADFEDRAALLKNN